MALTTMKIATMIATPSTQSTGGCPAGRGVPKSWKRLRARETTAAIDNRTCSKSTINARARKFFKYIPRLYLSTRATLELIDSWWHDAEEHCVHKFVGVYREKQKMPDRLHLHPRHPLFRSLTLLAG